MSAEDVAASLDALAARGGSAMQVLRLVEDPDTDAARLAGAVGADPVLAARVLGLANSSYYGLSGRVSALPFAVSVLGFQVVRGLAVAAAAGLDTPGSTPTGFWRVAATTAAAGHLVAPLVGADAGDAFTAGLLHTLGAALLHRHHPIPGLCLPAHPDGDAHGAVEVELYGLTHAQAAARVLEAWQFPQPMVTAIADHHDDLGEDAQPLRRALSAARSLAAVSLEPATGDRGTTAAAEPSQGLTAQGLTAQGLTAQGLTAQGLTAHGLTAQDDGLAALTADMREDDAFRQRLDERSDALARCLEPA